MKALSSISPSSIIAFDKTTPFGCERRWWFKYVLKNPEPQYSSMVLGEALHKRNEVYLMTGEMPEVGKLGFALDYDRQALDLFKLGIRKLDELRKLPFLKVEQQMPEGFDVAGIKVSAMSKCDVVTGSGIIDWKTTSDISKWGKTPGQLAKDTQMLIYSKAFHPNATKVTLSHGQYQTKGRARFEMPEVVVTRQQVDDHLGNVTMPLVERMKQTYLAPAAKEVEANRAACRRCPHRAICPPDKENPLMGVFSKFQSAVSNVTPPDAPKSDPEKAAKPVEPSVTDALPAKEPRKMKFIDVPAPAGEEDDLEAKLERQLAEAKAAKAAKAAAEAKAAKEAAERAAAEAEAKKAEEAESETQQVDSGGATITKRGPGRPPGAKNKATIEKEVQQGRRFTSTTVEFGVTLNLGINVGAVRIAAKHTIDYGDGDAASAFAEALKLAKAQVETECERVQADMAEATSKRG